MRIKRIKRMVNIALIYRAENVLFSALSQRKCRS